MPEAPVELAFDLLPISYVFRAGHRIRVIVTFAEPGSPVMTPAPEITIYRSAA